MEESRSHTFLKSTKMQVTISTTFEIPNVKYTPRQLMEFLDFKAGVKKVLGLGSPFNRVASDPPKVVNYEYDSLEAKPVIFGSEVMFSIVQQVTGVTAIQIRSISRKREFVYARHLFAYFMSECSGMSLKSIGEIMGKRHHTTVIHSRRVYVDLIRSGDEYMVAASQRIKQKIKQLGKIIN